MICDDPEGRAVPLGDVAVHHESRILGPVAAFVDVDGRLATLRHGHRGGVLPDPDVGSLRHKASGLNEVGELVPGPLPQAAKMQSPHGARGLWLCLM